ncbi:MAG: histidine kinase [Melioribacteraceae bacterium]|nr:histidine kinase [Melioribacteraceae bacterium]
MPSKYVKCCLLLVVINLLLYSNLYSQTPPYYHYDSADGLASSTVYQIIHDRNGFIWIATANGLSKFDGKNFTTFRTKDGLNSNSIISMAEGKKGELFLGNYTKGINLLRNGKIEKYYSEINGNSFSISYLLLVNPNNKEQEIYAYTSYGAVSSFSEKDGKIESSIYHPLSPIFINKLELLDNNIIALTTNGLSNFTNNKLTRLEIEGLPALPVYCLAKYKDGSYLIGTKRMIFGIKENKVIKSYKIDLAGNNEVTAMLIDSKNNIWFSIMNKGFFMIPNASEKPIDIGSKMDLQNTLVNSYLEDNEGNIWISTYGKGVYCLNNLYIKNYNEKDGLSSNSIQSIIKDKSGKLFLGTFNGINVLDNGIFTKIKVHSKEYLTEYIYGIKNINGEYYFSASIGGENKLNLEYKGIQLHISNYPSLCKTGSGLFLIGTNLNTILAKKKFNNYKDGIAYHRIFGDSSYLNTINEIFEDSQKNIWVGTNYGLCRLNDFSEKTFYPNDPVLNSKIVSIMQDSENNIWFAGEKGIAKYNLKNDSITNYENILGHDLASSTSIVSGRKGRIWIGNMNGLYLYNGNSIKYLNRQSGLPSNEVLSLFYDNKEEVLYAGTSNGISVLDIRSFDNYSISLPNVKITSIKGGIKSYSSFENLKFEPGQNSIYIRFMAINFASHGSVIYKYSLNGKWEETNNDFLDYRSLKSGTYKLQIIARLQNTSWGEPCFLTFQVLPKFYETLWFRLLVIAGFVCISLLIFIWRTKHATNKAKVELALTQRINELKHQALSAMMNPHFIFNSLNSVQHLVNTNKLEEANDYIAMMATLMRKNLDTARKGFILLSEEINRLKLYLDLEKLRFQDKYSYEIITRLGINSDSIMIPNMIIQPFVENSLWHGIINSGRVGLLRVTFSFEDVEVESIINKTLIIKITDNGIGIKLAQKNKKEDHISKGIQIIEERLRLLSTKMELPKPIIFEDLSDSKNGSQGTDVIISLPPLLYKISKKE